MSASHPSSRAVVVLGSINVDLLLSLDRLPGAGETVHAHDLDRQLGGKGANQAVAAARAGAPCRLIAAAGADDEGQRMVDALRDHGVGIDHVARVKSATGLAVVATSPENNQIIVLPGANAELSAEMIEGAIIAPGDVCIAQLETPLPLVERFLRRARADGAVTLLNPSPTDDAVLPLLSLVDVLIVNETERDSLARAAGGSLTLRTDQALVVTLGDKGVSLRRAGETHTIPGRPVTVVDTTGAGDCFTGYLAAALARGADFIEALTEANAAAALSVQSRGAAPSMPTRAAVLAALA